MKLAKTHQREDREAMTGIQFVTDEKVIRPEF